MTTDCKEFIWSAITVLIWLVLVTLFFGMASCSTMPTVKQLEDHEKIMIQSCCSEGE